MPTAGATHMIRVDSGKDLCELLACASQLAKWGRLDVAVPFFDADSELWRCFMAAVHSGTRVRLLTRPPGDPLQSDLLDELAFLGASIVRLPTVHAKSVLLTDRRGPHSMGWIGSHNFTRASERTAQELGVVFCGRGLVETRLLQQALIQLDAWEYESRAAPKLN